MMLEEIKTKISLIKNRLINFDDLMPNMEEFNDLSQDEVEKKGIFARDFGMEQWDWPQGVGIYGLHNCSEDYSLYISEWADKEIEKGLPTKNVNTICPMLTLIDFSKYDKLCLEWMHWLEDDFPRTQESAIQHITSGPDKFTIKENNQQIWVDTVFMTVLFMAKMGIKYDNKKWIDESVYQVLVHLKYLLDRESGLFYHGWNFEEKSNYGGNFWARGNSWITMGLPIYIDIVGEELPEVIYRYLKTIYNNQVKELISIRGNEFMWHTILNDQESYVETSGTSGILAGILLGYNNGILEEIIPDQFIEESINKILKNVDETGIVTGVSAGTAISNNKDDYKKIVQTPMVYGQAMLLIALEEYLKYVKKLS